MGSVLLVDAAYLLKTCRNLEKKIDYVKLTNLLEKRVEQSFLAKVFFNSRFENSDEKQEKFYAWLDRNGFEIQLRGVKSTNIDCPHCGREFTKDVQKGVDVAIATRLCQLATDPSCHQVVLIAGDGDFVDAALYFAQQVTKRLVTCGFHGSMSGELQKLSRDHVWIDNHWPVLEKVF